MKHINNLILYSFVFLIFGLTSCQKENIEEIGFFNIDDYTGRYVFDIKMDTYRDGIIASDFIQSVGYVTKMNNYTIKIVFDYAVPNINCAYEYAVKQDGSFLSLYKGVGTRDGRFFDKSVDFSEKIDLGNGNYKKLDFYGSNEKK